LFNKQAHSDGWFTEYRVKSKPGELFYDTLRLGKDECDILH